MENCCEIMPGNMCKAGQLTISLHCDHKCTLYQLCKTPAIAAQWESTGILTMILKVDKHTRCLKPIPGNRSILICAQVAGQNKLSAQTGQQCPKCDWTQFNISHYHVFHFTAYLATCSMHFLTLVHFFFALAACTLSDWHGMTIATALQKLTEH